MRFPNSTSGLFWGEALRVQTQFPCRLQIYTLVLQTGAVDGQDNAVSYIRSLSFYEVTESVTLTGHVIGGNPFFINEELYQSMSPELQQFILECAQEACEWISETTEAEQENDIAFLEEQGLTVYRLSDEELTAYSDEVKAYYFESETGQEITAEWDMDLYNAIQALTE